MRQLGIPADLMRSGTSRGVLLAMKDLPPSGLTRDELVREIVGSPDPQQIDGLGAGVPPASKVMAVGPSSRPGVDVETLFAEVAIGSAGVGYGGNCGNLSAAVGVWAIDHGLVPARTPLTEVAVFNLNTRQHLRVAVPCDTAGPLEFGDGYDAGIDRPAAPVTVYFQFDADTALTMGAVRQVVGVDDIDFDVTVSVAGSAQIVVRAPEGVIDFGASADELNADPAVLDLINRLRQKVIDQHPETASSDADGSRNSGAVPRIAFVETVAADEVEIRAMSMGRFQRAVPVTTAVAVAAMCRVRYSTAFVDDGADEVTLVHSTGRVRCQLQHDADGRLVAVGLVRTVRRIMSGVVFARALGVPTKAREAHARQS